MNSLPDLAKKTSINSLLNPEASNSSHNTNSYQSNQIQSHITVPLHPQAHHGVHAAQPVYSQPYPAANSFHLRAVNWTEVGGDRTRKLPEDANRQYSEQLYPDHSGTRVAISREHISPWQSHQHGVGFNGPPVGPIYTDERTAPSGSYSHPHNSYPYPQQSQPPSTDTNSQQAWQANQRAPTRLNTNGVSDDQQHRYTSNNHMSINNNGPPGSYYQPSMYHMPPPPYPQESQQSQQQSQASRTVQPPPPPPSSSAATTVSTATTTTATATKRRSPGAEDAVPPKQKRAKTASTAAKTSGAKKGYPGKKRSEAAQLAAQNAKLMPQTSYTPKPSEKGKDNDSDSVSMQIVPSASPTGGTLQAELQNTRCMSTKYKSDTFPRCVACTRRWAGDTCRFQGIRYFLRNEEGVIVGVSFNEKQGPDAVGLRWRREWNEMLSQANLDITKRKVAKTLLPMLKSELQHLRLPQVIHRPREREVRATCDTCMTSLFSSSWLCRLCGREACAECYATVRELTLNPTERNASNADGSPMSIDQQILQQKRREKHAHDNPFFLQCTKRIDHQAKEFSPMSRFEKNELILAVKEMEEILVKEEEDGGENSKKSSEVDMVENGDQDIIVRAETSSTHSPNSAEPCLPEGFPEFAIDNPFRPRNLPMLSLSTPSHPLRHFADASLGQKTFPMVWSLGEPLVVTGLLGKFKLPWTPEYFIEAYSSQTCLIIECQTEDMRRKTVGEFFTQFGRYGGRTERWKLKDWPPSTDFQKTFPELYEDFINAVPVPSYVRRDGVLNLASHFPSDTIAPDLGPKMYNAFASTLTAGSKGSTRLHMDMADAVNIMTFSAPTPDGEPGCAVWDIFRAEDSDKLRRWLSEQARSQTSNNGNGNGIGTKKVGAGGQAQAQGQTQGHAQVVAGGSATGPSPTPPGAAGTIPTPAPPGATSDKHQTTALTATDPIHGQQFYLSEEMRAALYEATGVKSFRFYQRPGEAVFIPAGCAHQVANLSDCIKVAVDFVSPENVGRCEKLTREFREQNQRKVWKEDVLQLKTMMWFAWLSCRHIETEQNRRELEGQRKLDGNSRSGESS